MEGQHQKLGPPPKSLKLQQVERLVEASPFKVLLRLPPEEVLDWLRSKVGQALLLGISELKRQELDGLVSSKAAPDVLVGEMYEVRGIVTICDMLINMEQQVKQYTEALKKES